MSYLERMVPRPGMAVLVTAGASGIGAAMTRAFLEAGAKVAICDVDRAALDAVTAAHPEVLAMVADVSETAQVDALMAETRPSAAMRPPWTLSVVKKEVKALESALESMPMIGTDFAASSIGLPSA